MSKYIQSIFTGLAIGTSLGVFFIVAVYVKESFNPHFSGSESEYISNANVAYSFDRIVKSNEYLTLIVNIENKSERQLTSIWLSANLHDSIGLFGTCSDRVKGLEPNEKRPHAIQCHGIKSNDVPSIEQVTTFVSSVEAAI